MSAEVKTTHAKRPGEKELAAAMLLLAKKMTALSNAEDEERMESIIDEYTEVLSRL